MFGQMIALQYLHSQFYYICTTILILSHTILVGTIFVINKVSQIGMLIQIQSSRFVRVNTKMHDYTIDYYCYCLCISCNMFYCFVDSIKSLQGEKGKCICYECNFRII